MDFSMLTMLSLLVSVSTAVCVMDNWWLFNGSLREKGSIVLRERQWDLMPHTDNRITLHSRGFPEEVVLAEDGDKEPNKAFNRHGNETSSHNVPLERWLHLVKLAWNHTFPGTYIFLHSSLKILSKTYNNPRSNNEWKYSVNTALSHTFVLGDIFLYIWVQTQHLNQQ